MSQLEETERGEFEQPRTTFCLCKGACMNKDGRSRKGCPCKTADLYCDAAHCKCTIRVDKCKNKEGFVRQRQQRILATATNSNSSAGATTTTAARETRTSELEDCEQENKEVEELLLTMDETNVRRLAIRVLSQGVGSLEFIQSQLTAEENHVEDERSTMRRNIYGSPVASPATMAVISQPMPMVSLENLSLQPVHGGGNTNEGVHENSTSRMTASASMIVQHESPASVPVWCKCGHCREMPKDIENVCCRKKECAAETIRFQKLCLDADILRLCILNRADIRNDPFDNSTKQFRKSAYRQFILEKYGYLGRGVRRVVPSCCVWKVRDKYPSPTGVYMGYKEL